MAVQPWDFGKGYWGDRFVSTTIQQTTGGGGGGGNTRQSFTGTQDGVNTVFTLPSAPPPSNLEVFRNGVLQSSPGDYTLSTNTVTFTTAPQPTDILIAYYGGGQTRQTVSGAINGSNTVFTVPTAPASASLQFFWNGLLQFEGADYTLSGNTITMTFAPRPGDTLVAYF